MHKRKLAFAMILGLAALPLWTAPAVWASGFSFFEQGAKAAGMSGAFTAQADDPSALFHNAGGIAFFESARLSVGGNLLFIPRSNFRGTDPLPSSVTGEQKKQLFLLPHVYWVQPLSQTWKVGVGFNTPFGLSTRWRDPDTWAGRFISTKAVLHAFDLNPSLGYQITPKLGIGGGVIFRFSNVELNRRQSINELVPAPLIPPALNRFEVDRVHLESDTNTGYGWNVGLLHKPTDKLSWGFSYRSRLKIDYSGFARFTDQRLTGIPPIDAAISARIPFNRDLPVATSIRFPDMASLGVAYAFTDKVLVETDLNWTGWHRFRRVDILFTQGTLPTSTIPEDWKSVFNYRVGVRLTQNSTSEWRLGYFFDITPQPLTNLNPLLPDANRQGFSVGYGHRRGRLSADLYGMYVPFFSRTTTKNVNQFNGTYKTDVVVIGLTLTF